MALACPGKPQSGALSHCRQNAGGSKLGIPGKLRVSPVTPLEVKDTVQGIWHVLLGHLETG